MLKERTGAVLALAFLLAMIGVSLGKSQRAPANTRPVQAPSSQPAQPAIPEERGTDQSPLTVKILPGPESKEQAERQEHERATKAETDKRLVDDTRRLADDTGWLAIITAFLFVTALGQVTLFFWQLKLIRESLAHAKESADTARIQANVARDTLLTAQDTAERQLRAYVFPIESALNKLNIGDAPKFRVIVQNTGQTPAYAVRHINMFAAVDIPLEQPLPEAPHAESFSRTHLAPAAKVEIHRTAQRPDGTSARLTAEEIGKLRDGQAAIYVYGRIDFVDAFKRPRWVKYCYMIGGHTGFKNDGNLIVCEQGNETSEDDRAGLSNPP